MESKNEELTCPVCGYEARASWLNPSRTGPCSVICLNLEPFCGMTGPDKNTEAEAIAAWKRLRYGDKDGILISRRTFMMLPIEERRRIMEEQAEELAAAGYGEDE